MGPDYKCSENGFTNPDITIFACMDAAVDLGITRRTANVPDNLRRYGNDEAEVREIFYKHFRKCRSCQEGYQQALPGARSLVLELVK